MMKLRPTLQRLSKNTVGQDFVVGDIHGKVAQLKQQLADANFNPATDRLICTGDLIDRGEDSPAALALLDEPWFYSVLGNHEYLMLSGLKYGNSRDRLTWLNQGGNWIASAPRERWQHWFQLLEALPLGIELEGKDGRRYGIVHADYPHAEWAEFEYLTPDMMQRCIWSRSPFEQRAQHTVNGIDLLIHGHNVTGGEEVVLGNRCYIEPGAYSGNPFILKAV
ncbi:metallophosphoesterase [Thalassolituus sp. LLYu03]|uniref:metallophosphoesterase n=1 Tax=Thalassolituus sp. LLYu03 TaxID=3421656 RepID=UPI003D27D413